MIIGLVGHKEVGKSTVAKHIASKHMYRRVNMKDALIKELKENFPELLQVISNIECTPLDDLFTVKPALIRTLMQNYGSNVRRCDDKNYWIDMWSETIPEGQNVVVDDVRFENEADIIRENFGVIVRIVRSDVKNTDNHISETEHSNIKEDYTLNIEVGEFDKQEEMIDELLSTINNEYDL